MIYSWQQTDYQNLTEACLQGKLSALLLDGALNSGYAELIHKLIQFMLCLSPQTNQACGKCASCTLLELNNHPDYYVLSGETEEKKSAPIKIEQVRQAIEFAATSTHISTVKIIYIPNANELNLNSANALLKVLEEPPANCRFILYSTNKNRILPTIRSRCLDYHLAQPSFNDAVSVLGNIENKDFWLQYHDGEPFFNIPFTSTQLSEFIACLSRPSIENIFSLSKNLDPKKIGMANLLDFILKWTSDLVIARQNGQVNYFADYQDNINMLIQRIDANAIFNFVEEILFLRQWSEHPLNQKLQLESMLFKYQQLFSVRAGG